MKMSIIALFMLIKTVNKMISMRKIKVLVSSGILCSFTVNKINVKCMLYIKSKNFKLYQIESLKWFTHMCIHIYLLSPMEYPASCQDWVYDSESGRLGPCPHESMSKWVETEQVTTSLMHENKGMLTLSGKGGKA